MTICGFPELRAPASGNSFAPRRPLAGARSHRFVRCGRFFRRLPEVGPTSPVSKNRHCRDAIAPSLSRATLENISPRHPMIPLLKTPPKPVEPQKRFEVVVADDVESIRELVTIWLQGVGYSVTAVSSGRELIQAVKDKNFDLVVTDIVMPDGDGWDAILAINRLRPETRILAISGGSNKMPTDPCLRGSCVRQS
ncbi:MAG: response regulator [Opitutus sp.]|nr:response regulator [Opitutus sp.]